LNVVILTDTSHVGCTLPPDSTQTEVLQITSQGYSNTSKDYVITAQRPPQYSRAGVSRVALNFKQMSRDG